MNELMKSVLLCFTLIFPVSVIECPGVPFDVRAQGTAASVRERQAERRRMVDEEIVRHGIADGRVLRAMRKVPRHRFVPAPLSNLAYQDRPLPIGLDQTISQPSIVAYMSEAAEISPHEKVLEIGTGSGYQAAILGELAKQVYSLEIIPELGERARRTLDELGYKNIHVKIGNGYEGWAEHAPYDAIIVTAAPEEVPPRLVEQLAVGGRMVIPVGAKNQEMLVIRKTRKGVISRKTIPVRFVPMTGKPSG